MPSGVHLADPRRQLFDAAERVLLRDGPHALTSRAVTEEAGCAKGVLHRYFADFDAFLVDLVLDRAEQLQTRADRLLAAAGTGSVVDNLSQVLTALFEPVTMAIIPLITFRDELRLRLRRARPGGGIAILGEATAVVADYLRDEQARGRLAADADLDSLTLSLVGGGHLMFVDHESGRASPASVRTYVASLLAGVLADGGPGSRSFTSAGPTLDACEHGGDDVG